jgi:hypothetical protein
MDLKPEMFIEKLQMLACTQVSNEHKVSWLKLWNQFGVLEEVVKFPKQGFSDGTFDKCLHKATF